MPRNTFEWPGYTWERKGDFVTIWYPPPHIMFNNGTPYDHDTLNEEGLRLKISNLEAGLGGNHPQLLEACKAALKLFEKQETMLIKCICEVDGEEFEGEPGDTICPEHMEAIQRDMAEQFQREAHAQNWADFFRHEEEEAEERREHSRREWFQEQAREEEEQAERNRRKHDEED